MLIIKCGFLSLICSGALPTGEFETLLAEAKRTIHQRFDALKELISPIVPKVICKVGSELDKAEVEWFNKSYLPAVDHAYYVLPTLPMTEEYEYVHRMVLEYTHEIMDIAKQKNVNEETHIHPPTFKLLQALVKHLLPAHEMEFFEKNLTGTAPYETRYETSLNLYPQSWTNLRTRKVVLSVTGETDQLICIGGVPVGNVEVKNVGMPCNTPSEIGEVLAEAKGFAARHKQRVGVEPRLFPSVIVSGQRWVFVDRAFVEGDEQYLQFPTLVTFELETAGEDAVCKINESSVEMVSRMLMRMMHAMGKLIKAIATRKRKYDVYADKPTAASKGAKGGKGGKGGGKKRATQSTLTMENMYQHDLDTLWHRIKHF